MADTVRLRKQGWNIPPGSRKVLYSRLGGILSIGGSMAFQAATPTPVGAALLALSSDTPDGKVLPLFSRCLPQAELLHQSLVKKLGDEAPRCPVLTGRHPETEEPLQQRHAHAHYLPLDLDEDGRLDHVIVHAAMRLDAAAQGALEALNRTWTKGGDGALTVTLAGFGTLAEMALQLRTRSGKSVATLDESRQWVSVTPFVPPRHLKKRRHTLEDQVRHELQSRGLPAPTSVETLERDELIARRLLRFVRTRRDGKPQPPAPRAFGLRLVFEEPRRGPISLGYASHYGLGLFGAEAEAAADKPAAGGDEA